MNNISFTWFLKDFKEEPRKLNSKCHCNINILISYLNSAQL